MPLSFCSNPTNPCSVEDDFTPVGRTTAISEEMQAVSDTGKPGTPSAEGFTKE